MEQTLTDSNFEQEVLKAETPVFVDFWAPWCGPCRAMGPVVEELAKELEGRVKIGKLNVDENAETSGQYSIMSIPTFVMFKGGKAVEKISGGMPKERLREFIEKNL